MRSSGETSSGLMIAAAGPGLVWEPGTAPLGCRKQRGPCDEDDSDGGNSEQVTPSSGSHGSPQAQGLRPELGQGKAPAPEGPHARSTQGVSRPDANRIS